MAGEARQIPDEMAGGLCYVLGPFSGFAFLYFERYRRNPFVRFHAWQSIFFSLESIVLILLAVSLAAVLPLEYVSAAVFGAFGLALILAPLWFYTIVQALNGKEWSLPLAGPAARRFLGRRSS